MHGQELIDAIGAMNSEQLQEFCEQDAERDGDECAALEMEGMLFDALYERLDYDVRDGDTPEAEIITQLVEALDVPTTWQMLRDFDDAENEE